MSAGSPFLCFPPLPALVGLRISRDAHSHSSSPPCPLSQVQLDTLPGMSLMAGKALSSARMSDVVLSQSSLMGSQPLRDGESEGKCCGALESNGIPALTPQHTVALEPGP